MERRRVLLVGALAGVGALGAAAAQAVLGGSSSEPATPDTGQVIQSGLADPSVQAGPIDTPDEALALVLADPRLAGLFRGRSTKRVEDLGFHVKENSGLFQVDMYDLDAGVRAFAIVRAASGQILALEKHDRPPNNYVELDDGERAAAAEIALRDPRVAAAQADADDWRTWNVMLARGASVCDDINARCAWVVFRRPSDPVTYPLQAFVDLRTETVVLVLPPR